MRLKTQLDGGLRAHECVCVRALVHPDWPLPASETTEASRHPASPPPLTQLLMEPRGSGGLKRAEVEVGGGGDQSVSWEAFKGSASSARFKNRASLAAPIVGSARQEASCGPTLCRPRRTRRCIGNPPGLLGLSKSSDVMFISL